MSIAIFENGYTGMINAMIVPRIRVILVSTRVAKYIRVCEFIFLNKNNMYK